MPRKQPLSGIEIFCWTALGIGGGLAAGVALSEWIGGVSRVRVRRAAARLAQPSPAVLTSAAAARAVDAALRADPKLAQLTVQVIPGGRGTVELHGWVPTRAARALAGRVALGLPGIDRIVNSLLVRGEDDHPPADPEPISDQSA